MEIVGIHSVKRQNVRCNTEVYAQVQDWLIKCGWHCVYSYKLMKPKYHYYSCLLQPYHLCMQCVVICALEATNMHTCSITSCTHNVYPWVSTFKLINVKSQNCDLKYSYCTCTSTSPPSSFRNTISGSAPPMYLISTLGLRASQKNNNTMSSHQLTDTRNTPNTTSIHAYHYRMIPAK